VLACLLAPAAGLLRELHLTPVLLIRRWHRRTATPSTSRDVGAEGFSVKERAIGRPDSRHVLFEQEHAECVRQMP
jgi:hypothetical protein